MTIIRKVLMTVFTAYVVFLLASFLFKVPISKYLVERQLSSYLNQVIERDPDVASEFYLSHTDLATIAQHVKEGGFELQSFKNVEGEYDDGCVCTGHVDLTFDNGGEALTVRAVFTTGSPRQVCAITPSGQEDIPVLTKWNKFACGGDF